MLQTYELFLRPDITLTINIFCSVTSDVLQGLSEGRESPWLRAVEKLCETPRVIKLAASLGSDLVASRSLAFCKTRRGSATHTAGIRRGGGLSTYHNA